MATSKVDFLIGDDINSAITLSSENRGKFYIVTNETDKSVIALNGSAWFNDTSATAQVLDKLDSDATDKALSANQGKILNERLEALENAPSNSVDVKKDTLKLYRKLGATNAELKPFTDDLRASMIGLYDFAKLGTGLFIHWGVYAVPAGNYTGTKVSTASSAIASKTSTNYNTEWIMRDLGIPRDVYKAYENQFTAANWNPEELCKAAYDCGMGYVVLTIKHHDGFSLYPTEYGNWDVRTSAARNTIVDELKEACDKYKLKFGLYFSQYWDWMAEGGFGLNHGGKWCSSDLYTDAQHKAYCNKAVLQINEFVEKYEPDILWYDPGTNYSQTYKDIFIKAEEDNYPHVITNDRLDYNRTRGDYGTGERTIYLRSLPVGEACFTMNDTWGYSDNNENKYFGIEKVMKQFIIYSLSYGQNCLMNIGPKADGSVPTKQIECLANIKSFIEAYGTFKNYKRATTKSQPSFGYMLELADNKLLCYVVTKGNPSSQDVVIDCVSLENLVSVDILTSSATSTYTIENNKIYVKNLALDSATKIGVVRLNYSEEPKLLDANLYDANTLIPSRVFPMVNNASWDFNNLIYITVPTKKITHTTEFIWNGESGNYTIDLNRTRVKESPIAFDDVTTITIKNLSTSASQTTTYAYDVSTCDDTVSLEYGQRYSLSLHCEGTESSSLYNIQGFTFKKEVIIIHPTSVTLNETELMIAVGGIGQLEATVLPADSTDASVTWSSGDEGIVTVDDGIITAVAAGDAYITVTTVDGNHTASCHVIVTAAEDEVIHATDLELDLTNATITIGENIELTPIITPDNATYQIVRWYTSDSSVITVDDGLCTAIGEGNATVTSVLEYDSLSATCTVTVNPIHVQGITIAQTSLTMTPGYSETLTTSITPTNATHQEVVWSSSDEDVATVVDGVVSARRSGTATIKVKTVDGDYESTCTINVIQETYDYLFRALSLDGSTTQGDDTGIKLFSSTMNHWTLFGYAHASKNPNTDNNATLYQCVVNASPWSGLRIDADNNNYPTATAAYSPLIPRLLATADRYINPVNGAATGSKPYIDVTATKHPVCISRDDDVYKFSIDGKNWTTFEGLNGTQLARLVDCEMTVAFDYRRASGQITTTKYRFLKTDHPCCVALKNVSEYPFFTLYQGYDRNLITVLNDTIEYTTVDGEVLDKIGDDFAAQILTNTYANEKGTITLATNTTSIDKNAFDGLDTLETIIIPQTITEINANAFTSCTNLKKLTLPVSITSIEEGAIGNTNSSLKIYYQGLRDQWTDLLATISQNAYQDWSTLNVICMDD